MSVQTTPTPEPLQLYFDRWQALDSLMGELGARYATDGQLHRGEVIVRLLGCLRAFAEGQFKFFFYGFQHHHPGRLATDPLLEPSDEFPPEDVLTAILNQVGHDLALIEQAADQRRAMGNIMQATLKTADTLASLALQPAMKYGIIARPDTVLTYMDKSAEFYNIPYAKIALISIPSTCAIDSTIANQSHQDFLAIPHEAGHYVYRNLIGRAAQDLKDLRTFAGVPPEYQQWIRAIFQEMCADIYGCLVAGPVIARDFQDLSLANGQLDFSHGDNLHPNPALRPLIYCQVLDSPFVRQLTHDDWQPFAATLAELWNQQLYHRHVFDFVIRRTRIQGQNTIESTQPYDIAKSINPVTSQKPVPMRGPVGNIVHQTLATIFNSIFNYLEGLDPPVPYKKMLLGWSGEIKDAKDLDALLGYFNTHFDDVVGLDQEVNLVQDPNPEPCDSPDQHVTPNTTRAWREWAQGKNPTLELFPLQDWRMTREIPAGEVKDPDYMQAGTWGSILYADGWTNAGSGNDRGQPGNDRGQPGNDRGQPQV